MFVLIGRLSALKPFDFDRDLVSFCLYVNRYSGGCVVIVAAIDHSDCAGTMTLESLGYDKLDDHAIMLSFDGTVSIFVSGESEGSIGIQRTARMYVVLTRFKLNRAYSNWATALELHFAHYRIRFQSI